MDAEKKNVQKPPNPRASANILSALTLSMLTFSNFGILDFGNPRWLKMGVHQINTRNMFQNWKKWTIPIFTKSYKKDMEVQDLFVPLKEHTSSVLGDRIERNWYDEVKRAQRANRKASLMRVLFRTFGSKMMIYGVMLFISEVVLKTMQPLFLQRLLSFFTPGSKVTLLEAYGYAAGVILCTGLSVMIMNPFWMAILHIGMKLRVACCSLIYRKTLRLSKSALGQTTVGQVVNMMSNDVNRFDYVVVFVHYLWIGPITAIFVAYFLWNAIGWAAVYGMVALLISIPLQMWLGKKKSVFREKTATRTDERIRLMNEIITGMQVIKMYTWEKPFSQMVADARSLEMKEIRGSSYIQGVMLSFLIFHNRLAVFCSIIAYIILGNALTAGMVYVVSSYFAIVRQMLSDFFPLAIAFAAETMVSIRRLERFMLYNEISATPVVEENGNINKAFTSEDERNRDEKYNKINIEKSFSLPMDYNEVAADKSVVLKNVIAKWNDTTTDNTLDSLNIYFKGGEFAAIIGPVGSGKSSLLHAILKELPLGGGNISVSGSISYASQEPWLFDGSVRQNILFGSPYNEEHYKRIVHVCALRTDFEQFPFGDRTLVGDRGVVLSGGQKARINLARAIYKDADIYLLDDPLSAVDAHVGKHLFENCITGYLRGKTCILVTHQLQYLTSVRNIVLIQNGTVSAQGTYQDLKNSDTVFKNLLAAEHEEVNEEHKTKRRLSFQTGDELDLDSKAQEDEEQVAESRVKGNVSWKVFMKYITAGGGMPIFILLVIMAVLTQFVASGSDYWLNYWTNLEEYFYSNSTSANGTKTSLPFYFSREVCIIVFTILILGTIVISLARSFLYFYICTRSSQWLHDTMFFSLTRSAMRFFSTNPVGRILNRFTKDMGLIDEILPSALLDVLQIGLTVVGIIAVVAIVNPWLLVPTIVVAVIFSFMRSFYLKTSRNVKRLEGVSRSPVFTHMSASLQGLTTIRAFNAQKILEKEFDNHQDLHSSCWFIFIASERAFGFWLDIVCLIYIAVITLSFLLLHEQWFGASVGLVITQAVTLTGMFQWGMKQSAELENNLTSVERVLEYCNLEKEPPLESAPGKKPPGSWPQEGKIVFSQVTMAYASSLPPVLKNLSFTVQAKEKLQTPGLSQLLFASKRSCLTEILSEFQVGIVGRTGAGKSSLITALFRLTEVQGDIIIDNINTSVIGLHDLRSKISIIPQEPILFSGTLRKNLDPFQEFSDHVLWNALEEVELKEAVEELPGKLSGIMSEGGSNFSVGQRQLICLARAIVRNNKVLILDEATANVDPQTDILIQNTIRRKFSDCTVLTIAHRLHTVMDSDRILVMDSGTAVEFDHPHILLQNKQGYLYKLVEQTGKTTAETLHSIAAANYQQTHKDGDDSNS